MPDSEISQTSRTSTPTGPADPPGESPVQDPGPVAEGPEGAEGAEGPEGADLLDAVSDAIEAVASTVARSIVAIRIERPGPLGAPGYPSHGRVGSVGSGVVISGDGLIVTAAHVVARAETITVTVYGPEPGDTEQPAVVVGSSESDDLALLKIDVTGLTPIDLTPIDLTTAQIAPGRIVLAVGRPPKIGFVVTDGIVNVTGRTTRNFSGNLVDGLIQTTAAVEPGVSGGALVDSRGRLAGIVTSAPDSTRAISFAVPAERVRAMVAALASAAAGADQTPQAPEVSGTAG